MDIMLSIIYRYYVRCSVPKGTIIVGVRGEKLRRFIIIYNILYIDKKSFSINDCWQRPAFLCHENYHVLKNNMEENSPQFSILVQEH